jgi:hypothetical protein
MELDHVFMFAVQNSEWQLQLQNLGLVETYRRRHPGQGTANSCYCFDNAFLEILWIENEIEALSEPIRRCQFETRSKWPTYREVSPFGIAWRGSSNIDTWSFYPPYLPQNKAILVATDSDDIKQPFMFSFPSTSPPSTWAPERRGNLQSAAGYSKISIEKIILPETSVASAALDILQKNGCVKTVEAGLEHSLILRLEHLKKDLICRLQLPYFTVL